MSSVKHKHQSRIKRHRRVRKKIQGTPQRPRFAVYRSNRHIVAQIIDDTAGHTLVAASSTESKLRSGPTGNIAGAIATGKLLAERAKDKNITTVVFDRGGFRYHGRVAALADSAREAGLEF
ncbi:MAG: 50S ribosomal protein L18 [Acidimicrobiia bacterium]|nr:50S ribosomal protein L18 [Acidimicrobiia bacterium]MYC58321.1 50S ribosomal protein L18 [Acidimicrobiia bacterium]MYG93496.1 50S ribosomal protein L18 [Acidimicrobiia bacterium]MYI29972.1 50S ribosomal protein L18 [Acidimicrobiia bacterium]